MNDFNPQFLSSRTDSPPTRLNNGSPESADATPFTSRPVSPQVSDDCDLVSVRCCADTRHSSVGPVAPRGPFSEPTSISDQSSILNLPSSPFFEASTIADVSNCSAKTIHRRAKSEQWQKRLEGNRYLYQPPVDIMARLIVKQSDDKSALNQTPVVTFTDIAIDPRQAEKVNRREEAVILFQQNKYRGKETALALTVVEMKSRYPDALPSSDSPTHRLTDSPFSVSVDSLRTWVKRYALHGKNGLVEQKRGIVGKRGVIVPDHIAALGKALKKEHGSVARAARELASHPDLPSQMRNFLHGGHASKSYVTPSIRTAITPAPLTENLLQGPRHAKLQDRFTPGDYSDTAPGEWFVSDDMTDNVITWCEWPNADGYRIGQLQILPVMDIGALRWLNVRGIMRDGGQYNSDDIWGLFGDTFDKYGLPRLGFLLEGGHWQSKRVQGERTGIGDEERIGGLESLGLKCKRAYDPRGKGMLEGAFHTFQHAVDRSIGFCGRSQRHDLPEKVKAQIAAVKSKRAHPREFFLHVSQRMDHVQAIFEKLNHERQDGQILRGGSPLEKWASVNPRLDMIPDSAKWLYRSSYSVVKVTGNGLRITRGSGAKMEVHYYDNPALLVPRQGTSVIVHWDDYNPTSDAVLRDAKTKQYIGLASYVQPLSKFNATDDQLAAEAGRKRAAMQYARTEARTMQPHLVRSAKPVPVNPYAADIGARIAKAREQSRARQQATVKQRRDLAKIEVPAEFNDLEPVVRTAPSARPEMSLETAREILGDSSF